MSKITKKKLQADHNKLLNQFAELVRSLKSSKVISEETCPTFYRRTTEIVDDTCEQAEPKLKKLDQSVFDGLDEDIVFAAVDADGRAFVFDTKPDLMSCEWDVRLYKTCRFIEHGYDTTNWQNSLIERDLAKELLEVDLSSELTGSDLCRKMLARGDKCVLIRMGVRDDKQAKEIGRFAIATSIDESGRFNVMSDQQPISKVDFAIPINNQGEPLTQSDVGL